MSKRPLPIVSSPTLVLDLPVSKKRIKYRPFIIKEQKAMLLAQQSMDDATIAETVKSIIKSCTDGTLDISTVPTADLAYFFVQLRIASVGSEVRFGIPCESCGSENIINLNLDLIKVDASKVITKINLTDTVGIVFRLPTIEDTFDKFDGPDRTIMMVYELIDSIYDDDQVYSKSDYTADEFKDWIETLSESQILKIREFVDSIPELTHTIRFKCTNQECQHPNSRTLEGLHSFFRIGDDS